MDTSTPPYQVIVDEFPEGIVFLFEETDDLRYTFVGGEGLDEIGLTKESLEGQIVAEDRPPEIKEKIHSEYRKALDGEEVTFETEAEGRHFQFQLRPIYDESGAVTEGLGVARDITEQVVYREELERSNERLEQFTQLVFHDIQNPLNVAQGRVDLLQKEIESEHIEPIVDALDRIESLTNDEMTLLDSRKKESFETVDLELIATAAWQNVATKTAHLRTETNRTVHGNTDDLRRLFENLFRNAVEHGGEDVTVTVTSQTGFFVEDDGRGISKAQRDTVFERGVSHAQEGTGLGLFIVKSVVNAHGWRIAVTETTEGGARFEITTVNTSS